jgi:hypothetical protein
MLLFLICILLLSCESFVLVFKKNAPPPHAKVFHFYPDEEIYYYPSENYWVMYQNNEWVIIKEQPKAIASIKGYIEINDDSGKPWLSHSFYKKNYPKGHLKKKMSLLLSTPSKA